MADVSTFLQSILADGSHVYILYRCVREFLRAVERGQAIQPVVGHFRDAYMRLSRIGVRRGRNVRARKDLKQRCLAHLWQADNASLLKPASSRELLGSW